MIRYHLKVGGAEEQAKRIRRRVRVQNLLLWACSGFCLLGSDCTGTRTWSCSECKACVSDHDDDSDTTTPRDTGPPPERFESCEGVSTIPALECEALLALYHGTGGVDWSYRNGWLDKADPCEWGVRRQSIKAGPDTITDETRQVRCSGGRVVAIFLEDNNLVGEIPSEVGDLLALEALDLSGNQLGGTIPPEIGNLTSLSRHSNGSNIAQYVRFAGLNLSGNALTGTIPLELGELTSLEDLNLSNNQLEGEVPTALMTWPALEELRLSGQGGCLTAATPAMNDWLVARDANWNDGCMQ